MKELTLKVKVPDDFWPGYCEDCPFSYIINSNESGMADCFFNSLDRSYTICPLGSEEDVRLIDGNELLALLNFEFQKDQSEITKYWINKVSEIADQCKEYNII